MRASTMARWLTRLYILLAVLSVAVAVAAALRGQYGSAALNTALAVVWAILLLRLRGRR